MSQIITVPHRIVIASAIFAICASRVSAQVTIVESHDDDQPTVYKMTVSPAAEPKPALKYRFLVPAVDQIHENAATFYYKSLAFEGTDAIERLQKVIEDEEQDKTLMDSPLDQFPQKQAQQLTSWLDWAYFDWLKQAARCDHCDWGDNIREFGIAAPLPQIQKSRGLARSLVVYARLQIAQGHLDRAIETFRVAYALSRNLGHGPTLIHALIGIAVQGLMDYQVPNLIAQPDSPNLYWALTDLAAQPVDLREALSYEFYEWEFTIHELSDLDRRNFSPAESLEVVDKILKAMSWLDKYPSTPKYDQAQILATALWFYPKARSYLLDHGYQLERLDAMPVLQTVLLAWWKQYELVRDDAFKRLLVPDDEVRQQLDQLENEIRATGTKGEGGVFMTLSLPSIHACIGARLRSLRHTELLRIVEALRMYAAEYGHWPSSLDDIAAVPIPRDPWSQKPFEYSVKGGVATLQALAEPKTGWGGNDYRYELTLRADAHPKDSGK